MPVERIAPLVVDPAVHGPELRRFASQVVCGLGVDDCAISMGRVRTVMIKPNNNKLAIGERTYALRLEPWMPARQIAWLRRRTMAVVLMPAGGANGQSSVTIPLWLAPDMITTKLSPGG